MKLTRILQSAFFRKLGGSFHNFKAFDGMHNGAEMHIEKATDRHYKNFTSFAVGRGNRVHPTRKHENGRGQVD